MKNKPSKKAQVLEEIFKICKKQNNFVFDNAQLKKISTKKGFTNQFDVSKLDNTDKLPQLLKDENYFVVHLGKGQHQFVKGIEHGYHAFEDIKNKNKKLSEAITNFAELKSHFKKTEYSAYFNKQEETADVQ